MPPLHQKPSACEGSSDFPLLFGSFLLAYLALARFTLPAEPAALKVNSVSFPPLGERKKLQYWS